MNYEDKRDLYTWGRGFEGQLGLGKNIKTASSPQYLSYFYEKSKDRPTILIRYIACGSYHSLCITDEV
jgi:alpha-tubulin suppressor-like RCC1 family protein